MHPAPRSPISSYLCSTVERADFTSSGIEKFSALRGLSGQLDEWNVDCGSALLPEVRNVSRETSTAGQPAANNPCSAAVESRDLERERSIGRG